MLVMNVSTPRAVRYCLISALLVLATVPSLLAQPVISSITPLSGIVGDTIAVRGSGFSFSGLQRITLLGQTVTSYATLGDTLLLVEVPCGSSSSGTLSVTNSRGMTESGRIFQLNGYRTPRITSFSPTSGAPGTLVEVQGANLGCVSTIRLNTASGGVVSATPIPYNSPSGSFFPTNRFSFRIPVGAVTSQINAVQIYGGGWVNSGVTSQQPLVIASQNAPPTITAFSPASGAVGTLITITGTNFTGTSLVAVGGRTAAFTVVSPTTITVTIPAGISGNSPITIITPNGQVVSSGGVQVTTSVRIADEHAMRIFPQPADGSTTLEYSLSGASLVQVEIVNSLGARVVKYDANQQIRGLQRMTLATEALAQGAYFVRVNIGGKVATMPLQVVR